MVNSHPPDPKLPEPEINDTRIGDNGDELYWDGVAWVPYVDPPEWPGEDPDPKFLVREH